MRTALLIVFGTLGLAATASAQSLDPSGPRLVVGAHAGFGSTWDDEGSLGAGLGGGLRAGLTIGRRHVIEAGLTLASHRRQGVFTAEGRTLLGEVTYTHLFGGTGVRPFVLGGAVLARHRGSTGFPLEGQRFTTRSTDPGVTAGAGVLMPAGGRLSLGPEARITLLRPSRGSAPAAIIAAGVRVVFDLSRRSARVK